MKKILLVICMMSLPAFAGPVVIYYESDGPGGRGSDPDAPHWEGEGEFIGADVGVLTEGEYLIGGRRAGNDLDSFIFTIAEGSILVSIDVFLISRLGDNLLSWEILSSPIDDPLHIAMRKYRGKRPKVLFQDIGLGAGDYLLNALDLSASNYELTLNVVLDSDYSASVPEPGTLGVMASLLGIIALRRRNRGEII